MPSAVVLEKWVGSERKDGADKAEGSNIHGDPTQNLPAKDALSSSYCAISIRFLPRCDTLQKPGHTSRLCRKAAVKVRHPMRRGKSGEEESRVCLVIWPIACLR